MQHTISRFIKNLCYIDSITNKMFTVHEYWDSLSVLLYWNFILFTVLLRAEDFSEIKKKSPLLVDYFQEKELSEHRF